MKNQFLLTAQIQGIFTTEPKPKLKKDGTPILFNGQPQFFDSKHYLTYSIMGTTFKSNISTELKDSIDGFGQELYDIKGFLGSSNYDPIVLNITSIKKV